MKTDHIIILRFSALGDVAMAVPVVASLAAQYPKLRISFVSRPMVRPLFQGLAPNVEFMAADVSDEYHGVRGLNALYRRLVAKHPTAVADLHDVLRTKYLRHRFALEGFKVAHIDKHRQGKSRLCARKNKVLVQQPTSFANYADVFAELGYPVTLSFTSIFPPGGADLSPRRRCAASSICSASATRRGGCSFSEAVEASGSSSWHGPRTFLRHNVWAQCSIRSMRS